MDLVKSQNDINDTSAAFDNNGTWTEGIESAMHWLIKDEIFTSLATDIDCMMNGE